DPTERVVILVLRECAGGKSEPRAVVRRGPLRNPLVQLVDRGRVGVVHRHGRTCGDTDAQQRVDDLAVVARALHGVGELFGGLLRRTCQHARTMTELRLVADEEVSLRGAGDLPESIVRTDGLRIDALVLRLEVT